MDRAFLNSAARIAVPAAMQSMLQASFSAVDQLMIGRLGSVSVAGVGLAGKLASAQGVLTAAVATVAGVMMAQYLGAGDRAAVRRSFLTNLLVALGMAGAMTALCRLLPLPLMRLYTDDQQTAHAAAEYLALLSLSFLPAAATSLLSTLLRCMDRAALPLVASVAAAVCNTALNAVLIFGLLGAPAMGVRGAALATVCARVLELAWCVLGSRGPDFIPLTARAVLRLDRALSRDFWHYTLPILGASLLWGGGFTSYTAVMGHLGPDAAAGNSIAAVVRDLLCCLCNGFCGASAILIGNELGAGRLETGRRYGDRVFVLAFVVGFACTLLTLACIPILSRTMKLTPQAHEYMVGMFVILSVYMIGRSFCTMVINGIFTAGGDTRFDVYSLLVAMYGIALPCAFLGAFHLGWPVLACYACTCLDEVGKIPWVCLHYRRYQWVRNITRDL